ncbi:FimV/HubP family polar landmark protein [Marinobacterium weihaiense]|uniref:LysM domain-containing protein n=1 Tax=Marinobacterium weihaiense TaxID=2851016 RepID=A0ABS6M6L4_9GAMM|nr:FimV/HubP family polar landmark protein [Marinobacterium weihaiense]MBV0931919.1 hypothetical protein [Marinobacterium weihaiense]
MLRKLALSLAVSAALGASQVNALGLGAIQVNSALNEPLDAEITLTQVRDLSPLQIQPRMASLDEYATASGGSQARYLRDIQFQVLVSPDGRGRIRLKSSEPVQEPFLNFMVEVNWPSGRMVREYTLLLDPPVFEPTPVGTTRSVTRAQTREFVAPEPSVPVQPRATTPTTTAAAGGVPGGNTVSVGANDTLWDIAKRNKPSGTTEHQMMLALLRKNPQAFLSGNINNLKAGASMTIPSADEVNRLTHREAVAEVARQMEFWRNRGRRNAPEDSQAPLNVSKTSETSETAATGPDTAVAPASESGADDTKLTVVAPTEESADKPDSARVSSIDSDSSAASTDKGNREQVVSATAERLENDVLMAQEQIDRLERDNADLNDKLSSVLEQLESQSRLLELQSQQMSTLQDELSRKSAAAPDSSAAGQSLLQSPMVLGGLGAGALALLGGLLFALRRKRGDKSEVKRELVSVPDDLRDEKQAETSDAPVNVAAATAVGAAAAGAAVAETSEVQPSIQTATADEDEEFVRPAMSSLASAEDEQTLGVVDEADDLSDLDQDLQELDLDMDLDLDDLSSSAESDASGIDSPEFDLGAEDDVEQDLLSELGQAEAAEESDSGSSDDGALEFSVAQPAMDESSELDSMLANDDDDADDLDFLLNSTADDAEEAGSDDVEDLLGDLDFPGGLETDAAAEAPQASDVSDNDEAADNSLNETVQTADELEFEVDPELEAMLQGSADDDEELFSAGQTDENSADADLDSLLASFDPEDDEGVSTGITPLSGEEAEEELASNISHDLEMDLNTEVDELLDSTDDEIELDEQSNEEQDEILDKMNLLSDADEIETKLDLARAYIEMEDDEGARDILNEITSEGSEDQRAEARKLLDTLG